jgi:hypothetical protein
LKAEGEKMMGRDEILTIAGQLIGGDRQETYGDAKASHTRIADLWSAYLGVKLSASDVAACMVLMKVSRTKGQKHTDNWIDICGYAALGGEMEEG